MAPPQVTIEEYEKINPVFTISYTLPETPTQQIKLSFFVPNQLVAWRVNTILSKEPETIAWIGGFKREDIFFDVGANIGLYSLWASATKGCQVFAFEPEAQNYHVFNRNIYCNKLSERIKAFPVAISDCTRFDSLYLNLGQDMAGGANHAFGEQLNCNREPMPSNFAQGCFSISLDDMIYRHGLPVPTHLKIDVDGLESKIMHGAARLLQDFGLKSLLIELNEALESDREAVASLAALGFSMQTGEYAKSPGMTSIRNYIFRR